MLEAIEKRYEERLKKLDEAQKCCQLNVREMKKLCEKINEQHNNEEIFNTIENKNRKMYEQIKKTIEENGSKANQMSFSDAIKSSVVMPDENKQNPLIVKPKEKQTVIKTKEDLNKKVNPSNFKIINVEQRKNGSVVIQSKSNEDREKIKEVLQNEISDSYEIKVPQQMQMKIKITGMTFKYTENEIIEKLKKQNDVLNESELQVIKIFENKKSGRVIYNALLKIDKNSYINIMKVQKVNIGWEKCKVFEGTDIIQCFKCNGYNHKAAECKNELVCYKCHGNHRSKECVEEVINKCINCVRVNTRLNLGLDENHSTTNRDCPVFQNKLNAKRRWVGLIA